MFNLHEQLISLQEGEVEVPTDFSFDGIDSTVAKRTVNGLTDKLVVDGEKITDPATFNTLMCFARDLAHIDPKLVARGLDMLVTGFENLIKQVSKTLATSGSDPTIHTEALDRYAFLFQWTIERGETTPSQSAAAAAGKAQTKGRGKRRVNGLAGGSSGPSTVAEIVTGWKSKILDLYGLLQQLLQMPLGRIWNSIPERDTFIGVFTRLAHKALENPAYSRDGDFQMVLFSSLCIWLQNYNGLYGLVTLITQNLQHYEHLSESMASLVQLAYEQYGGTQLVDEVLRDIAGKSFSSVHDKAGPKNTARFLIRLSQLVPKALLRQMGLLIRHLDSEAHIIRSAMADVVGHLTLYLASQEEQTEITKNQIGEYFDILEQRFQDAHYLVRAKVLQVCQFVCSGVAKFPKRRPKLIGLIIGRLQDKAANVRKHAIRALTVMLETHPFSLDGAELRITRLEASLDKISTELEQMAQASTAKPAATENDEEAMNSDSASAKDDDDDSKSDDEAPDGDNGVQDGDNSAQDFGSAGLSPETAAKAMHLQFQQRYYRDALFFVYQLHEAQPQLLQLLGSTSKSEVVEAMDYFVAAVRFRVDGAQEGIRRMSHLIWTQPAPSTGADGSGEEGRGIRTRLLDAYMQLYLTPSERLSAAENTSRITRNLISLTFGATLAELTSLEELIRTLMRQSMISSAVIDKLRSVYGYTKRPLPPAQRRGAIIILGMLAQANRSIVTDDIDLYLRIGLGKYGREDLVIAKYTCIVLQCLGQSSQSKRHSAAAAAAGEEEENKRLPMDNPIFDGLQRILEEPRRDPEWFPAAEQALNAIYALGEKPDALVVRIVRAQARLVKGLLDDSRASVADAGSDAMDVDGQESDSAEERPARKLVDAWDLTRLVFVVGHIAIKEIVLLESIEAELKRRKVDGEPKRKKRVSPKTKRDVAKGKRGGRTKAGAMQVDSDTDADDDDELNQIAGTTEDEIGDIISAIRERELLFGNQSVLALFGPLLVHICKNLGRYSDRLLTVHATAALAKFMCISAPFCEENLPLLLALLQRAKSPAIRANVSIALGDITVCFNNLIGENVHYLYGPLHDRDTRVKKTTLMVLTHLILNGMVKVKGQLGEIAKCLEDKDTRVADMARLFFSELSTKDNAVYNNLPDIISSLSMGVGAVDEESFARIMKFLFEFIREKDRQTDNVVEKLCQRFRNTTDARQCRDIAYCMVLLPFRSERSVRRLLDGMPAYQDKLGDSAVYKHFCDIATKARTQTAQKTEAKTLLEEYEAKLKEARARAIGEDAPDDEGEEAKLSQLHAQATQYSDEDMDEDE